MRVTPGLGQLMVQWDRLVDEAQGIQSPVEGCFGRVHGRDGFQLMPQTQLQIANT